MAEPETTGVFSNSECESDAELIVNNLPEDDKAAAINRTMNGRSAKKIWRSKGSRLSLCPPCFNRHREYTLPLQQGGDVNQPAPKDRFNIVYICMLMAGAGFLIPWSSYISALDYFFFLYQSNYPDVSVIIAMTYLLTTLFSATINIAIVERFPIHARIGFGYVMFVLSLSFVPLLDIGIHNCTINTEVSFYLTLLSIIIVGFGSGVQQSSYYGLSSMLPRKYTQAVMAGESIAGVLVSLNRIFTKAAIRSERSGAIAFFVLSLVFILVCVACQCYIRTSPFAVYHTRKCANKGSDREVRQRGGDVGGAGEFPLDDLGRDTDTKEDSSALNNDDDDNSTASGLGQQPLIPGTERTSRRERILRALKSRRTVISQIYLLIIAIFINFFVTLLLFPGLISEIQYCTIGDWTPVILVAIFNFTDFIAKWLALLPIKWSPWALALASVSRIVLIPLVLLCVVPSPSQPVLSRGVVVWAVFFTLALGLSNGYFGSLPMINVSNEVKREEHRELAGTIATWFLLCGLTLGSVLAYALTPLTKLADHLQCNITVNMFECSRYGNETIR